MNEISIGADYILTYSKIPFNPLDPVKEKIRIEDIAHALSLITRANGHFTHFYSVAQHSINCYKEALNRGYSQRVQLGCLLHDASEAYISDLTRPVKSRLSGYTAIEEKLQNTIYCAFGLECLSVEEKQLIEEVDDTLLYYEFEALMGASIFSSPPKKAVTHDFSQKGFGGVEKEFLRIFHHLQGVEKKFCCVGVEEDIRDKDERQMPQKTGLTDSKGVLKPEHEGYVADLVDNINSFLN